MGKRSRDKGAAWERRCAAYIRLLGFRAERNLEECRTGNSGDLAGDHPFTVQCKTGRRPSVWQAVSEAEQAARETGKYPVAMLHRDAERAGMHADEIVAMPLEWFIELLLPLTANKWWV